MAMTGWVAYNGAKPLRGRERDIAVDMLRLLLAMTVTSAVADPGTAPC